ncbi:MAG: DNA primase [Lachnospiraceae bacterium]|nr:DNA primase [Lachnospiraceae bacterium]
MFYSEELVEEVRSRNDIVDVISSYVNLKRKGSRYFGLCPFHNEKSASFSVSPDKQLYNCFGCGAGGNVYTFIMEYENYTFQEAIKMLAERGGVELPKEEEQSLEARRAADFNALLLEINKEAAKYFYYQLRCESGAQGYEYLNKKRGLSEDTIKKFGLGYSNKTSNDLYQYLKAKGYKDEVLKDSGLVTISEKGNYDKFWNRVMFPIMDVHNKVIGFGGRVMGEGEPKYLNSPETKVFDKSRNLYGMNIARTSKRPNIIVCEGYLDVIALHQAGFSNAVASLGTAFTSQHALLIKRYTKEVLLTYDSDNAGTKAALRAIPILKDAGLTAKIINMKPYKDPDEFIKNLGAEEFQKRIDEATNSFFFEIEVLQRDYDMSDPEQKTKFHNELARKLLTFSEPIERQNYIEAVAKRYDISVNNLTALVNSYGYRQVATEGQAYNRTENKDRKKEKDSTIKYSQRLMLTWLVEEPELFDTLKGIIGPKEFTEEFYGKVANLLYEQYELKKAVNPAQIINSFTTEEEHRQAALLFSTSLREELSGMEKEHAINETVKKLKLNWCEVAGGRATDFNELMEISKVKQSLQNLHISINKG